MIPLEKTYVNEDFCGTKVPLVKVPFVLLEIDTLLVETGRIGSLIGRGKYPSFHSHDCKYDNTLPGQKFYSPCFSRDQCSKEGALPQGHLLLNKSLQGFGIPRARVGRFGRDFA